MFESELRVESRERESGETKIKILSFEFVERLYSE
jgi:hypothetical protein